MSRSLVRVRSIVVTTLVTDGRAGVEEKPKWQGGSTGASEPRSVPRHAPETDVTATTEVAPYHSLRSLPAVPRVRTPRMTTRATGSTRPHQAGAVATRDGTRPRASPSGVRPPTTRRSDSEGVVDLPPVGRVHHRHRLDDLLVEGVGRGDEVAHLLRRGEEDAVARGVLEHHVGERSPRPVVPAADDDADAGRAADAGDPAGEALADAGLTPTTRRAGSRPSAVSPDATPARSASERFWLSFAFASTDETTSSTPTMGRRFFSM